MIAGLVIDLFWIKKYVSKNIYIC